MQNQEDNEVISHLKQALSNLNEALLSTIRILNENPASKKSLGLIWEEFLGTFFGRVRTVGKENKINLLNLISFSRLKKL